MSPSAGLLLYRHGPAGLEVLLGHPGGPFWARKDVGAWTLPKGAVEPGEAPLAAACREFTEETGGTAHGPFLPLGEVRLRGGKRVQAWACAGDFHPADLRSMPVEIAWPPRSGRLLQVPELDRVAWCTPAQARVLLLPALRPLLDRLEAALAERAGGAGGVGG
jgi:predicted NUDIX family NTP pyrophosphohydrolase